MKIVFICGSLEPAKDGVGDYTRRLAGELVRLGNDVSIIALNDLHITEKYAGTQQSEGTDIAIVRMPSAWSDKNKSQHAKQWVEQFDPEWISLQFVTFSFQFRGLTFGLSRVLKNLGGGRKWHIMFHELWVGMDAYGPKKHALWGWLQRQLIKSLLRKLSPDLVCTQTRFYQQQLAKYGFNAEFISLSGNIPVCETINEDYLQPPAEIEFINFGTIYPKAPIRQFAKEAASFARTNKVRITITLLGINGAEQSIWKRVCSEEGVEMRILGQQPIESVSRALKNASIGITTTAFPLAEKSGSVAAMREHRLPIICVAKAWKPRGFTGFNTENGVFEYSAGNFEECINVKTNPSFDINFTLIVKQFADALSSHKQIGK